jgi:hypothetical protein
MIVVQLRKGANLGNKHIGITNCVGASRVYLDRFSLATLPANVQLQQPWLGAIDDRDIVDQQTEHTLACFECELDRLRRDGSQQTLCNGVVEWP